VDVVEDVLSALSDAMVEELVNTGSFTLRDFITVTSHSWSGYKLGDREVAPTARLKVRLGKTIRDMWAVAQKELAEEKDVVTHANWRDILAYYRGLDRPAARQESPAASVIDFNPFLDEED
jgi:hypothetical protein